MRSFTNLLVLSRKIRQNINIDRFNNTIKPIALADICRTLYLGRAEHTFSQGHWDVVCDRVYVKPYIY